jgi:hypothetical protein
MKTPIVVLLLILIISACTSKPGGNDQNDSTKMQTVNQSNAGPFDLSKLLLKENLPDLMTAQGVKAEPKDSLDLTTFGFEVFKSSNPKILRFGNTDLSGSNGKNKNHVLFHYSEEKNTLALYEVELYTQAAADALKSQLQKMGKPVHEQTGVTKGAIELDENGNEVKTGSGSLKAYHVWENKANGLSYYLIEDGSGENVTTQLIVLNTADKSGQDWISFYNLDLYKRK